MAEMRKTPSYLKGLAETRARVAAEVQRYQKLHDEVGRALAKSQTELTACDLLIRKFDERLNPELIEPIKAWKGRYGKRGALLEAILRILKEQAPEAISTTELGLRLQLEFRLDFMDWKERSAWLHHSVSNVLRLLVKQGKLARLHDSQVKTGAPGRWRWLGDGCQTLDELTELANVAGVGTTNADEQYEAEALSDAEGLPR